MSSNDSTLESVDLRVGPAKKYRIEQKIGAGSFADIFAGTRAVVTPEETQRGLDPKVAIKLETVKARHPMLMYEAKIYQILAGKKEEKEEDQKKPSTSSTTATPTAGGGRKSINNKTTPPPRSSQLRTSASTVTKHVYGSRQLLEVVPQSLLPADLIGHCAKYLTRPSATPVGIPQTFWFGQEGDYNVLVMEQLGPSLEDLFNYCGRKFSLKTVLMIADQQLARLQYIHSKRVIHRDPKPDDWLMGTGEKSHHLYLIDYGVSKRMPEPKKTASTVTMCVLTHDKTLTGTARYSSINAMLGIDPSPRDDLEVLGFVWMRFLRGSLPWQGLKATTKREKHELISAVKMSTSVEDLCLGFPAEFTTYFNYVRGLRYEDKPGYDYCRKLLQDVFVREGHEMDYLFDWTIKRLEHQETEGGVRK